MSPSAVSVNEVWKSFRLYHEKNQYLKTALLKGRRSRFDEFWALQDVSFEVPEGSTFGIIGSNGSGKSTMLKCLAGILYPDKGSVTVNGRVAALLELGAGFHPELSGRENVFLNGAILGMTQRELEDSFDDIVDFAGLGEFIDNPVKNYSSGMVVRLGFAVATNVDPEILIIDEVLAVGDASFQKRSLERIEEFRKAGRTVILVSHGLTDVQRMCDTVAWLDKSRLRMLGRASDVVPEYLGASNDAIPKKEGELGERWGSGEIQIEKIEFIDSEKRPLSALITGSQVNIRIILDSRIALDNSVLSLRINSLHGHELFGVSTKTRGVNLPLQFGHSEIIFSVASVPLLEGTYELSVSISDESDTHEFDHWERRTRFDVLQDHNFDSGLITMESKWII